MRKHFILKGLALWLVLGTSQLHQVQAADLESLQNKNLIEVLQVIEKKFNIKFNYDAELPDLKVQEPISLRNIDRNNLEGIIKRLANDIIDVHQISDDNYEIQVHHKGSNLINKIPHTYDDGAKIGTQQELTGRIVDKTTNEPISGVSIRQKSSAQATSSDQNGVFRLPNTRVGETLVLSMVGYQSQEVIATTNGTYTLEPIDGHIEEVVVTALGIKREQRALGYAVQDIKGDQLQKVKGVDVGTTLTGRISGVRVLNSTEFNRTPSIQVRGMSPILVIDGIAYENMNLRDVPVDNIEEMTVLKGATATALYGSMGAGGAIMITTKKGLKEQGTEITVSTNNMFFSGYLALPEVQSSYSAGEGGKYNTNDYVWGDKLDIGRKYKQWNPLTKQMDEVETELTSRGKNNFSNFLEPGFISNNSVSFTNQGENGSIRTSISHIYNKGQYPNTKLNMTNISVSGETKISEKLKLDSRFGYNRRYAPNDFGSGYNAQGYIYNILVWTGPEYDLTQYKDYWLNKDVEQNWHYKAWYDNPYLSAYEKLSSDLVNKLNAAVTLNYKVTDWSNLMLRTGYDYYGNEQVQTNPRGIYGTRGGFSGYHSNGKYWTSKTSGFGTTNDLIYTVKRDLGDFSIDGLAGGAIFYRKDNTITASTVNGLSIPGFYSLRNSIDPVSTTESKPEEMINSVYGRLSLGWRHAIFIEATGRNDWSSALPKENRSYFYPSLSSSIVVSDLIPQIKTSWMNMFKLRGSWAVTKSVPSPYEINQTFSISSNVWEGLPTASYPNSIKDYSISPTQRDLTEFGADVSLFNNRLYANYTRYYRLLHNVTTYASISTASGFESRLINTGEQTMTKGHEITVGGTAIQHDRFKWDVITNFSQNLSYYHKLDPFYSSDALYVQKGMRTDHYLTRDWERSPSGEIVHNASGMPISATHASRLFGYTAPKWFWGFTNQFEYKNFGLSFSIDGRIKGLSYSNMNARLWQTGAHPDSDSPERYEEVVNGNLTFVGQGVKIVSGTVTYDKYGQILTDTREFAPNDKEVSYENYWKRAYSGTHNIWDETFIKMREISLNYYVPQTVVEKMRVKRASVGVTGQNLFLWTKEYRFSDPDAGSEDLNSPSMRYLGFNINLSF